MRLTGARVAMPDGKVRKIDLSIQKGRIVSSAAGGFELDLSGHLILPGLINSHDHLEFNLYPRLGKGPHADYIDWAAEVHQPESETLKQQSAIPKAVRLMWGGLKNLLSGVTTVAHHNPYEAAVFGVGFPVRVVRRFGWAHSLHFSPGAARIYAKTPKKWPFLIHAAEGTCARAAAEISAMDQAGMLSERTVLVHGVGLDRTGTDLLKRRGTSLIWCPSSNVFTLGTTLSNGVLKSGIPLALGTDSALTGEGDLIDEVRVARQTAKISAKRLFEMVTTCAAKVLRLNRGEGQIVEGGVADLLAVKPAFTLGDTAPELVLLGGKIKLLSCRLAERLPSRRKFGMERISLEGRGDYLVDAKVAELYACAASSLGPNFRLAGKRVYV